MRIHKKRKWVIYHTKSQGSWHLCTICHNKHDILYTITDKTTQFTSHRCHEPQLFVWYKPIFSCCDWSPTYHLFDQLAATSMSVFCRRSHEIMWHWRLESQKWRVTTQHVFSREQSLCCCNRVLSQLHQPIFPGVSSNPSWLEAFPWNDLVACNEKM